MKDWRDENKGPLPTDAPQIEVIRLDFRWVGEAAIALIREALKRMTFSAAPCCGPGKEVKE